MNKEKKRLYYYLFDWANSPYSTIIITFIFSSYFVNVIAENKVQGTSLGDGQLLYREFLLLC